MHCRNGSPRIRKLACATSVQAKYEKRSGREATPLLIADEVWYLRFCETYSHVTPQTKPNMHNKADQPCAGGVFQYEGLTKALDELSTALGSVAVIVCEYCQFLRPIGRDSYIGTLGEGIPDRRKPVATAWFSCRGQVWIWFESKGPRHKWRIIPFFSLERDCGFR